MEIIFRKLSVVDISKLGQTCKILNEQVGGFLKHQSLAKNIETDIIKKFLEENKDLLSSVEQTIFI